MERGENRRKRGRQRKIDRTEREWNSKTDKEGERKTGERRDSPCHEGFMTHRVN